MGLEAEARSWMEAVLGESLGDGSFQEVLKSGVHLCNLANKIKEGVCTKPSAKKLPFVQMENIGHYLAACTKLGMRSSDSFQARRPPREAPPPRAAARGAAARGAAAREAPRPRRRALARPRAAPPRPTRPACQTVALFEGKDMTSVVTNIHSLGRIAQQIGFTGPSLGVREATETNPKSPKPQTLKILTPRPHPHPRPQRR